MEKKFLVILILQLIFVNLLFAQPSQQFPIPLGNEDSQSLKEQVSGANENNESATSIIKNATNKVNADIAKKYIACLNAFGNQRFCTCLSIKLPMSLTFTNYVELVQVDNSVYPSGNSELDKSIVARNLCVQLGY